MMSALTVAAETAEHGADLPFAPVYFGVIALALFLLLLAITWAFRNTAAKYGQHGPTGPRSPEATAAHEPGTTH